MRYLMLICGLVVLGACQDSDLHTESMPLEAAVPSVGKDASPAPIPKPGAAVLFTSDFAADLQVGERAPMVIYLEPQYPAGLIEVEISGGQGLNVSGDMQSSKNFTSGQQLSYELMVGADQAGLYNLGVVVTVITDSGLREARAFAERISVVEVGTENSIKTLDLESASEAVLEAGETMLEATENIYTK